MGTIWFLLLLFFYVAAVSIVFSLGGRSNLYYSFPSTGPSFTNVNCRDFYNSISFNNRQLTLGNGTGMDGISSLLPLPPAVFFYWFFYGRASNLFTSFPTFTVGPGPVLQLKLNRLFPFLLSVSGSVLYCR